MDTYKVSALRYRPQRFEDVVGQQAITQTLVHAIEQNQLAQALLFCGPRGVGKTSCARILAKTINQNQQSTEDSDFAFNIFELDAASNNLVEDIRQLNEQVRIPPQVGTHKVYIIDEVHMLSTAAFNAFLKTLEEPPKHVIFILATTEKHKIIPTILSRCQVYDFKRIGVEDIKSHLKRIAQEQNIPFEEDALHFIALKADGALRDALSIFDRMLSFTQNNLSSSAVAANLNILDFETYFKITTALLEEDIPESLLQLNEIINKGFDAGQFLSGLGDHFRTLLVAKDTKTIPMMEVAAETQQKFKAQSEAFAYEHLVTALQLVNDASYNYKNSPNKRLHTEVCLMQLASLKEAEKKGHIIPSHRFKKTAPTAPVTSSKAPSTTATVKENSEPYHPSTPEPKKEAPTAPSIPPKKEEKTTVEPITISPLSEGVSSFSLSSVALKKNATASETKKASAPKLREKVQQGKLQEIWTAYALKKEKEGAQNIAAILNLCSPKLVEESIQVEVPNNINKKELQLEGNTLLPHLKDVLNNDHLTLEISVNEQQQEALVYTAEEKYKKFETINPALKDLKDTFGLEY